jgi:hypothetical protein
LKTFSLPKLSIFEVRGTPEIGMEIFPPDPGKKLFPRLRIVTDKRKPPWNFPRENEAPAAHSLVRNVFSLAHD